MCGNHIINLDFANHQGKNKHIMPFASIVVIIIKWWNKLISFKPNPFVIFCYVVLLVVGIHMYQQWTDIPLKTITMDIYEINDSFLRRDTIYADIDINLRLHQVQSRIAEVNRYRYNTLIRPLFYEKKSNVAPRKDNRAFFYDAIHHSDTLSHRLRARELYHTLSNFNDTIKNKADSIDIIGIRHILVFDVTIEGVAPVLAILKHDEQSFNFNNAIAGIEGNFIYRDSSFVKLDSQFLKPKYKTGSNRMFGFDSSTYLINAYWSSSDFSEPFSIFRLEDISQQYICLRIHKAPNIIIHHLAINTVGATDIKYKTVKHTGVDISSRMDGIDIKSDVDDVLLYIESKEGVSLQSLRLFFLTTLMSVVITLLISSIFSIFRNLITKRTKS